MRIQVGGVRKVFPLKSAIRAEAAAKARDIYRLIGSEGMKAAEESIKTHIIPKSSIITFGDYISAFEYYAEVKPKTCAGYISKVRTLLGGVYKIKKPRGRMARCGDSRNAWLADLNVIKLSEISHDDIVQWRKKRLHNLDPVKELAAKTTINSYLRALRTLFADKHLRNLRHLDLPKELPGLSVSYLTEGSKRYHSKIDAEKLIKKAEAELAEEHPEQFKVILLALCGGLRRLEIDLLLWEAVDFKQNKIDVSPSAFYGLKTPSSNDWVYLQTTAMAYLKHYYESDPNPGPFVLKSDKPARNHLVKSPGRQTPWTAHEDVQKQS